MLIGAGSILNFQSIQTYVIDAFTLHAASGASSKCFLSSPRAAVLKRRIWVLVCLSDGVSAGCDVVSAVARGVRVPAVRARDVQRARVRQGQHDPRVRGDPHRVSCVRAVRLLLVC